jgi:fructokinase
VYYTVGTGIGAGIVVNGCIVHGRSHPECGHIRIPRDPADDSFAGVCPYHADCLEGLASGTALQSRVGELAQTLPPDHPVWKLEARYLALAIVNTVYTLAPERIVLGGGVMQQTALFPAIRDEVRKLFNGYVGVDLLDELVTPAALGNDAGIIGAILLARQTQVK